MFKLLSFILAVFSLSSYAQRASNKTFEATKDLKITEETLKRKLGVDNLVGAILIWKDLTDAELEVANLRYAKLRHAILRGADLVGAKLEGADLRNADLRNADLRGADLVGAKLDVAEFYKADLRGADLREIQGKPYLSGAFYNQRTIFSKSLNPKEQGMRFKK